MMQRSQYFLLLSRVCQFLENEPSDTTFGICDNAETLEIENTLLNQCRQSAAWNELEAQFTSAGGNICVYNAQGNPCSDWDLEELLA